MSSSQKSRWEQCSARLHAAIDEAVQVPLSCLDGEDALACLVDLQVLRSKLDAVTTRALADPGAAELMAGETGHRSVAALVAAETKTNPRVIKAHQHLGTWLTGYPILAEAFTEGRLSVEHLKAIRARENSRTKPFLPGAQGDFVHAAETCQWAEFIAVLRYWELAADPDGQEPQEQVLARRCNYNKRHDGTVSGTFTLDPLAGQAFVDALERHTQRLFRQDTETGSPRTATQRRADALIELITTGGTRPPGVPLVHVVMSEQVAADQFTRNSSAPGSERLRINHDDVDGRCEFGDGTPLHPHFALAIMATAAFRRLILTPDSERLDLGRAVRGFPPHLKQLLMVRARGRCQHPGCDAPVQWLQADHLIPWSRGGNTSITNGQILCDPHNKLKRDRPPPAEPTTRPRE